MGLATRPFDPAEFLDSEEAIEEYVRAASQDGDTSGIARALGVVARARSLSALARETGLSRISLYEALSGDGSPELATVAKVARALGFRLPLPDPPITRPDAAGGSRKSTNAA